MSSVFLIGGGRGRDLVLAGFGPFARAASGGRVVAVVLDDPDRWRGDLAQAGARDVTTVVGRVPSRKELAGAAAVFVGGGETPRYQELLCADSSWLPRDIPFGGFSAGAAIAARRALVGGWRADGVPVCDEEAGEGLDEVELRPGLGLVPFTVEVHAAQWGTLSRLVATVDDEAWAMDEGTCLEVEPERGVVGVHGVGRAWRVRRSDEVVEVMPVRGSSADAAA